MRKLTRLACAMAPLLSLCVTAPALGEGVSLAPTVRQGVLTKLAAGRVDIRGEAPNGQVLVRVTNDRGISVCQRIKVVGARFHAAYPADFAKAPHLKAGALFIDATSARDFGGGAAHDQAEAMVIVYGNGAPDLPSGFTCGLIDAKGRTDARCRQWPAVRALTNLYLNSNGARLARANRPGFDLANPTDLAWYKNNLCLYEFDYRDRAWNTPLGARVARTFWQSVWNTWYNSSNDNPVDSNPANSASSNYRPYAFANDFADNLIMYAMRAPVKEPLDDNLATLCREGARNLMEMQHRGANNFALPDSAGRREIYTAGAFRYGMFDNGQYMHEGNGWFYNPAFRDYEAGGVLNGRSVWGLAECLKAYPKSPEAARLRDAINLALRFCLHDGSQGGYVKRTPQGNTYWRDAGEHAYLVLGMLAALQAAPDMRVSLEANGQTQSLREVTAQSLNALVDLARLEGQWSIYPNVDSMAIAALAQGAKAMPRDPSAPRWRATATRVADGWMAAKVDPAERVAPCVHFGLRTAPDKMTYVWQKGGKAQIFYYQTGHWIHALADLYALTGSARYRDRAQAMISYLCGDNPFRARLFNEMGGVYNWTDDTDGDGIEDLLKQDMYPESTAFCQIGIMRFINTIAQKR